MGDDWRNKFDFLSDRCSVIYLSRTPDISTTEIKRKFGFGNSEFKGEIQGMATARPEIDNLIL